MAVRSTKHVSGRSGTTCGCLSLGHSYLVHEGVFGVQLLDFYLLVEIDQLVDESLNSQLHVLLLVLVWVVHPEQVLRFRADSIVEANHVNEVLGLDGSLGEELLDHVCVKIFLDGHSTYIVHFLLYLSWTSELHVNFGNGRFPLGCEV
jgi:hypothetical protein